MNPAVKSISVDRPFVVAFVWEPGNCTRYEMAVVQTCDRRLSVCCGNLRYGCELPVECFELPRNPDHTESKLAYIGEKLRVPSRLGGDTEEICKAAIWAYERMQAMRDGQVLEVVK